jgi:hypothetical protein
MRAAKLFQWRSCLRARKTAGGVEQEWTRRKARAQARRGQPMHPRVHRKIGSCYIAAVNPTLHLKQLRALTASRAPGVIELVVRRPRTCERAAVAAVHGREVAFHAEHEAAELPVLAAVQGEYRAATLPLTANEANVWKSERGVSRGATFKSPRHFNNIGVLVFILSGAPLSFRIGRF